MQITETDEIVAAYKTEAEQLIPILKRQIAETKSETRKWMQRCQLLEIELLRLGWNEDNLAWIQSANDQQVS